MIYSLSLLASGFAGTDALSTGTRPHGVGASRIHMSSVSRNANMGKLQAGYLFPEIGRRRNAFLAANPDAKIISLGIGDTTLPVPEHILGGARLSHAECPTFKVAQDGRRRQASARPARHPISTQQPSKTKEREPRSRRTYVPASKAPTIT